MLKKLINDLARESITLNQGLTRGKLIGAQIKNDAFTKWVTQELSGYDIHDWRLCTKGAANYD
jgi:AbiTii